MNAPGTDQVLLIMNPERRKKLLPRRVHRKPEVTDGQWFPSTWLIAGQPALGRQVDFAARGFVLQSGGEVVDVGGRDVRVTPSSSGLRLLPTASRRT